MKEKDRVRHVTQLTHTNVPTPKERQYLSIHLKKFFIFTPGFPISPKLLCFQLLFSSFFNINFHQKTISLHIQIIMEIFSIFLFKGEKK